MQLLLLLILAVYVTLTLGAYVVEPGTLVVTPTGITAKLKWNNKSNSLDLPDGTTPIPSLALSIRYSTKQRLRIRITDPNDATRWEVPGISIVDVEEAIEASQSSSLNYAVSVNEDEFGVSVTRKGTGEILWKSTR